LNVKTYAAGSMADALAMVRRGIGSDAVVLHTRTYRKGGVFGFGAKTVVEVTAADGRELGRKRGKEARHSPRAQRLAQVRARHAGTTANPAATLTQAAPPLAGDLIRKTYLAAKAELGAAADAAPAPAAELGDAVVNVQPIPGDASTLAREMRAVREMVARVMHQQSQQAGALPAAESQDALFKQYLSLIENEVAEELAQSVVSQARAESGAVAGDDEEAGRHAVRQAVARAARFDEQAGHLPESEDGKARVIALVGPTGVGKTTTIAKLAATFKLKQGKDVAMITLDTYRIAAVDQLKTYANILGVPLEVVTSPHEVAQAVARHSHRDAVLIDTAGRSQRDDDRLTELSAFIKAARPHETHLVLSSTSTQRVLLETVERFAPIQTDRIIFTKLDEAVTFGTLINVASRVNKKLSYFTTGQEVPHQIEAGTADRLARLVMGEDRV